MNAADSDHRWVRDRLAARELRLLEETEAARLEAHLSGCPACREAAASFAPVDDVEAQPPDEHVAPAVLARWGLACRELRGLEREMTRRHLVECDRCRSALELLGHEPVLPHVPHLELGLDLDAEVERLSGAEEPRLGHEPDPRGPARIPMDAVARELSRRISRLKWMLGGWAVSATTAAAVLAIALVNVQPIGDRAGPAVKPPTGPAAPSVTTPGAPEPAVVREAPPAPRYRLQPLAAPARLRESTRGEADEVVVRVARDAALVELEFDVPPFPEGSPLELRIVDANGRVLSRRTSTPSQLGPRASIVLVRDGGAIEPGRYVLRVLDAGTAESGAVDEVLYHFRIVVR